MWEGWNNGIIGDSGLFYNAALPTMRYNAPWFPGVTLDWSKKPTVGLRVTGVKNWASVLYNPGPGFKMMMNLA